MNKTLGRNRLSKLSQCFLEPRILLATTFSASSPGATSQDTTPASGDDSGDAFYRRNGSKETFRVAKGKNRSDAGFAPRSESEFAEKLKPNTKNASQAKKYTFTGQYDVKSAKKTTIFQILNTDDNDSDNQRPILYLQADTYHEPKRDRNGKVRRDRNGKIQTEKMVRVYESSFALAGKKPKLLYDGSPKFDLKVTTNSHTAQVYFNGVKKHEQTLDRYPDSLFPDHDVKGKNLGMSNEIRYGAYHHDLKSLSKSEAAKVGRKVIREAASTAEVVVSDAELVRD